jgi:hypothetical protein
MRRELSSRRASVTSKLTHLRADGTNVHIVATFGFDERRKVREVFCSSFKDGTDLRALVMDACICLSLLLQHGYAVREVYNKMTPSPQSLLATLIEEAIKVEEN